MGELDNYNWWWTVALDGALGAVLSAVVAVVLLWLAFRAERRSDRDSAFEQECQRLLGVVRAMQMDMHRDPTAFMMARMHLTQDFNHLLMRAGESEPCFVAIMDAARSALGQYSAGSLADGKLELASYQGTTTALTNLASLLGKRLAMPRYFKMSKGQCDALVEAVEGEATFI